MIVQEIALELLNNVNIAWSLILLMIRYTAFLIFVPGIGAGERGIFVRGPAILIFSYASLKSSTYAQVPVDAAELILQAACEFLFGMAIGFVPFLIVTGVQTAAQLASTSMGFGAGQLFDPTSGTTVSDLGKLFGDLTVILFLFLGGDHAVFYAVSGLAGNVAIGSYLPTEITIDLLINRSANIFQVGVMLSSPIIAALLLTQFVMGLISKAVPTVNIFIVSFPLTISIGLILFVLAMPDMIVFVKHELTSIEGSLFVILQDSKQI